MRPVPVRPLRSLVLPSAAAQQLASQRRDPTVAVPSQAEVELNRQTTEPAMLWPVSRQLAAGVELGSRRAFAWAVDWPGWCRSGPGEEAALAALTAYRPRYFLAVAAAGESLPAGPRADLEVVERLPGSTTTDFGAPSAVGASDALASGPKAGRRMAALLAVIWDFFDQVAAQAPAELRKGPRGGGRDRDQIIDHVLGADFVYASKLGVRRPSASGDQMAVAELRAAVAGVLRASAPVTAGPRGWPPRYYARRAAWHVLDHAWEIQDRSEA